MSSFSTVNSHNILLLRYSKNKSLKIMGINYYTRVEKKTIIHIKNR